LSTAALRPPPTHPSSHAHICFPSSPPELCRATWLCSWHCDRGIAFPRGISTALADSAVQLEQQRLGLSRTRRTATSLVEPRGEVRAETKRQAAAIHAYRLLQRYDKPIRNRSDAEGFLGWLRAEGLGDSTIAGLMTHYRQCSGGNRHLFSHKLKWQRRSVLSDVLSVEEIQMVLSDLESNEPWYYPLFLLWLSTGMRNGEIRGLTWDCLRWVDGELLISKSLRRDGYNSDQHSWAPTKTGRERVVPLTPQVLETLKQHQQQMKQLGVYAPYGLVFVTPTSHTNIYDHLVGRVWHRSLLRCGLKPRRLYAQRHSFLSHALAMGNSPADLAAAAGHSTKMLLDTYAKPTGRLKMPIWQTA
jgi:integrase